MNRNNNDEFTTFIDGNGKVHKVRKSNGKALNGKSRSGANDRLGYLTGLDGLGLEERTIETKNIDGFDEFDPLKDTEKNKKG